MAHDTLDHIHGSILGLAVGDAIGTTVETMPRGSFVPLTGMVGGGKFNVLAGQWTDDTSMALCVAESVVECQGHNPIDQLERFSCWYDGWHFNCCGELIDIGELSGCKWHGYGVAHRSVCKCQTWNYSSYLVTMVCPKLQLFEWHNCDTSCHFLCHLGKTVRKALEEFRKNPSPYPGPSSQWAAGNGTIMRLCPLSLAYARNPALAMEVSARHSRTTHGAKTAIDACRFFAGTCTVGPIRFVLYMPQL